MIDAAGRAGNEPEIVHDSVANAEPKARDGLPLQAADLREWD